MSPTADIALLDQLLRMDRWYQKLKQFLGGVGLAVIVEQCHERDDAAPPSPMADTLSLEDRGSS